MPAVTIVATVGHSQSERSLQPEGHDGIPGNPDSTPPSFPTVYRSDNSADYAVIPARFDALRFRSDSVTLTVYCDRFQIQSKVVVCRNSDHQLDACSSRYDDASPVPPYVLVGHAVINAIIAFI
jgi:hypothetical protein